MKQVSQMLNHKQLLLFFEKVLTSSNILINSVKECESELKNFYLFDVSYKDENLFLYVNIRNISSAYLPNKPYILRRQVGKLSFEFLPANKKNSLTLLLGITNEDESIVVVCWNPFYFIGHSTNRSCYVLESSLTIAKNLGLYVGEDCKTPVLVCSTNNFEELLEVYRERNMVD